MAKCIVITSGKGGVGKTTVTANLGFRLASLGKRVCITDADFGLNNLDVVTGVENLVVYDVVDCIEGKCRAKQALIQSPVNKNLYILPAVHSFFKGEVSSENLKELIDGLSPSFDYILIDCPAGIDDGATIRLRDRGEAIAGGSRGDLYVHIRVKAHKKFTREGNIILSEEHISMVDAALGTEIDVETVDGVITMKIPAGTQSGTDFKLSGHGVPHLHSGSRGPHIVGVIVDTPTKLTKKQKELLEQFKGAKKRGLFS